MDYRDFTERILGSCRRKHLEAPVQLNRTLLRTLAGRVRRRGLGAGPTKRRFRVPAPSALPADFIRLDPWEIEYLFAVVSRARQGIVETGRFNGGSVFVMACANADVPIHSIDIAPRDDASLTRYMRQLGIGGNVDLIVGDSQRRQYDHIGKFDVLFIDGDHSYEGCSRDLENWWPKLVTGGQLLLHDCYFGSPVQPAVLDFMAAHEVEVVQSPYIGASHWHYPTGSVAHLIKRG